MGRIKKEVVRLRVKKLTDGSQSLYLDIYIDGKRSYEFLKMYIVPERTTKDRISNQETLTLAETIKSRRTLEVYENKYGLNKTSVKNVKFLDYLELVSQKRKETDKKGMSMVVNSLIFHLKRYIKNPNLSILDVDKKFISGFMSYLKTAKSRTDGKPLKVSTQINYCMAFKIAMNQGIKDCVITENPFKLMELPRKEEIRREVLNLSELKTLHDTPCKKQVVKDSFLFCCYTGLRYSDISLLKWENLTKDNDGRYQISLRQKKTKTLVYIPLSKNSMKYLPEQGNSKETDVIFKTPSSPLANSILKEWIDSVNIRKRITFHCSRHTFATNLLSSGVDIYIVKRLMGHSDIKTTQIYTKVTDPSMKIAIDRIPEVV